MREWEPPRVELGRELGIARDQLYKWQTELRARWSAAFLGPGARKETPLMAYIQTTKRLVGEDKSAPSRATRTDTRIVPHHQWIGAQRGGL